MLAMKRFFSTLGIIAVAAFVFTSCDKEQATSFKDNKDSNLVTISFNVDKIATRTQAVEGSEKVSYQWTDEDIANIKLFTVDEGALKEEVSSPTITKVSATSLTISTTVPENSTTTFRAILCKSTNYTGSGAYSTRKPKIATTQTPNGTSNYDSNADILVSDDIDVTVGSGETSTGAMSMVFHRQVVVNKMTLKNMVEGEKVNKVVISSDKYLTGFLENGTMSGQAKSITLHYDDVAVPASGQFPVYFITMPNAEQTLSVEVTTDQFVYTKTFTKTIDFNLGEFTKFSVALPTGTPLSDLSGYYLIACRYSGAWHLMDSEINTGSSNHFYPKYSSSVDTEASSVDFSEFSSIANIDKYLWKVEAYDGAYSIKSVNTGNYLSYSGSANAAQAVNEVGASAKFTISIGSSTATIESANVAGRFLKYNNASPRFAFYTSGQQEIFMIPATYDDRTPVTLSFANSDVKYDTNNYGDFAGQDVTASPNVTAVTNNIDWNYVDTDGIIKDFVDGALELNGNVGSATITASFAGDGSYRDAVASYTITVTTAGAEGIVYTLTPASGSNNSYTGSCDIKIDGITWNLTGNSQQQPWRIGGKSLNGVDRELFSKDALDKNISRIDITHGAANSITINSMTIIVSKNSDFSSPISTITPEFVNNGTVTVNRPDGKDWSDCYYKIVYNVTVSATSNKFLEFSQATFTGK